jgi:hypothetical protein
MYPIVIFTILILAFAYFFYKEFSENSELKTLRTQYTKLSLEKVIGTINKLKKDGIAIPDELLQTLSLHFNIEKEQLLIKNQTDMTENESIGNNLINAGRCLKSVITASIVCAVFEIFLLAVSIIGSEYKSGLSAEEAYNKDQNIYIIMAFIALFYFIFFLYQTYSGYNYIIKAGRKMNEN